jgi:hypothetical protein
MSSEKYMNQQWRCSSGRNEREGQNRVKLNLPQKLVLLKVSTPPSLNANVLCCRFLKI